MAHAEVTWYGFFFLEIVEDDGKRRWIYDPPLHLSGGDLSDALLCEAARHGVTIINYDPERHYLLFDEFGEPVPWHPGGDREPASE